MLNKDYNAGCSVQRGTFRVRGGFTTSPEGPYASPVFPLCQMRVASCQRNSSSHGNFMSRWIFRSASSGGSGNSTDSMTCCVTAQAIIKPEAWENTWNCKRG